MMLKDLQKNSNIKQKIRTIIFGANTPSGKLFDVVLLILIIFSLIVVMLESVNEYDQLYHKWFIVVEWVLTITFSIEYGLRIYSAKSAKKYVFSFYGIVDLLSILPTYLSLVIINSKYLLVIRAIRLLRVFRIFKLVQFMQGRDLIFNSLRASLPKIIVFLSFILISVSIIGTVMYLIESNHPESGFVNIPMSIYWSIVTITTVGYGDISPVTPLGRFLASAVMILGYAIIAVPTGIVSSNMLNEIKKELKGESTKNCQHCDFKEKEQSARYCKNCGEPFS